MLQTVDCFFKNLVVFGGPQLDTPAVDSIMDFYTYRFFLETNDVFRYLINTYTYYYFVKIAIILSSGKVCVNKKVFKCKLSEVMNISAIYLFRINLILTGKFI